MSETILRVDRVDEPEPNPAEYQETVTHSFTVSMTFRPGAVDAEGKPLKPEMSYKPEGKGITPDDCLALALQGAQWAFGARIGIQEKLHKQMAEAAKSQSRIVVPGRSGLKQ